MTSRHEHITRLRAILASPASGRVKRRAVRALGKLRGDDDAVAALIEGLEGSDQSIRVDAARALGELRARTAVAALCRLLEGLEAEPNEDVPPAVVWALGEIGDRTAAPTLADLLSRTDEDDFLFMAQREALYALADLGCPEPIRVFADDESRPAELRQEAVEYALPRSIDQSRRRSEQIGPFDGA